ncbi:MAG: glycogen synthase [Sphaerochaetaceae bacterium]|nr:glycogen synthase [Sphaerochaetaceae bacterium]
MKKILFVASECVPFVKTGGLADVVGSLPKSIDKRQFDVRVIIPNYHAIKEEYRSQQRVLYYFQMDDRVYVGVHELVLDGITYYFIDNERYFGGLVPYYDMFQDLERFAFFSKAVLSSLPLIDFRPDIIHCHDWQASLVPVYLNTVFQGDPFFRGIRTVMTIHNIRFQGTWDVGHIRWVSGLPDECFMPGRLVSPFQDRSVEFSSWNCSMLRGGIVYSDYVTTVSRTYAQEIQTMNFGDGLDDILRWRSDRLIGIVNGIDYDVWNPMTDGLLATRYSAGDVVKKKVEDKLALQQELGMGRNGDVFTLGIVSRLTDQKGLDLIDQIMDLICQKGINLVVLGTGDGHYENMFRYYQGKYPGRVSAQIYYSESLAHRIYAGVDALLIPSAFEPCGLTQLISLRYGTVPIVHEIGGLKDTVEPYNEYEDKGTGFSFAGYSSWELMDRINHAHYIFQRCPESWHRLQVRGMEQDNSWKNSSEEYQRMYGWM